MEQKLLFNDNLNLLQITSIGIRVLNTENADDMSAPKHPCDGCLLVLVGMNSSPVG